MKAIREKRNNKCQRKAGFTLLEALLAAAILALAAYALVFAFKNGQRALVEWETEGNAEGFHHWAVSQIELDTLSRDLIEEGGEFVSPDGWEMRWDGEIIETHVLDVFEIHLASTLQSPEGDFWDLDTVHLIISSSLYENENDRSDLVEDKEEYFENLKQARERRW